MSWQEDQFRRNQAEAARTRARIAQGNARMAADNAARMATEAVQSRSAHEATMKRIARDGENLRRAQTSWQPSIKKGPTHNTATPMDVPNPGRSDVAEETRNTSKLNGLVSLGFLSICLLWFSGKVDGNVALTWLALLMGFCLVVAVIKAFRRISIALVKITLVLIVGSMLFWIFTRK